MQFATDIPKPNNHRQLHDHVEAIYITGQIWYPNAL